MNIRANASNFLSPSMQCSATFYAYHFETEMIIFRQHNGLKDLFIRAQCKRSVALGGKWALKSSVL